MSVERLNSRCDVIARSCALLLLGRQSEAIALVATEYPLEGGPIPESSYSGERLVEPSIPVELRCPRKAASKQALALLHARDGYMDRYTGARLIAPCVFKLIGHVDHGPLRGVLPYDVNGGRGVPARRGRRAICHQAGFELYASYEHVRPISVGGADELPNLVSAAFDTNSAKGNETWAPACPPGALADWAGLTDWFLEYTERNDCSWFPGLARERRLLRAAFQAELRTVPGPQTTPT